MGALEKTARILNLKQKKNAVILAHNYQIPEVQDMADFVGDSLGLSRMAATCTADIIVFCGVHFMAETASILCPKKKVLLPDADAGCSLAESINVEQLVKWKKDHPGAIVVSYVNTSAEVKQKAIIVVPLLMRLKLLKQLIQVKKFCFYLICF